MTEIGPIPEPLFWVVRLPRGAVTEKGVPMSVLLPVVHVNTLEITVMEPFTRRLTKIHAGDMGRYDILDPPNHEE